MNIKEQSKNHDKSELKSGGDAKEKLGYKQTQGEVREIMMNDKE